MTQWIEYNLMNSLTHRFSSIVSLSLGILLLGNIQTAFAATPTSLTLCVKNANGMVRVVYPPHHCRHHSESTVTLPLGTTTDTTSLLNGSITRVDETGSPSPTGKRVVFTGVDVQIVNGSGTTSGPTPVNNGGGNLIIGYNQATTTATLVCSNGQFANEADCLTGGGVWGRSLHSGYHNVVIGDGHSYSSYGGLVAGNENAITRASASVSGGRGNLASGSYSSVTAGSSNIASGEYSSVTGGSVNKSMGLHTWVSGGGHNTATSPVNSAGSFVGFGSSVSGGYGNISGGDLSSVTGGANNNAATNQSTITGGQNNVTSGIGSSISGGNGVNYGVFFGWAGGSLTSP